MPTYRYGFLLHNKTADLYIREFLKGQYRIVTSDIGPDGWSPPKLINGKPPTGDQLRAEAVKQAGDYLAEYKPAVLFLEFNLSAASSSTPTFGPDFFASHPGTGFILISETKFPQEVLNALPKNVYPYLTGGGKVNSGTLRRALLAVEPEIMPSVDANSTGYQPPKNPVEDPKPSADTRGTGYLRPNAGDQPADPYGIGNLMDGVGTSRMVGTHAGTPVGTQGADPVIQPVKGGGADVDAKGSGADVSGKLPEGVG